jgi:hypothetical protein
MAAAMGPLVRWRFYVFDPLSFVAFPDFPHDFLHVNGLNAYLCLQERSEELVEDHLASFSKLLNNFEVEHEDVVTRIFVSTLGGEA